MTAVVWVAALVMFVIIAAVSTARSRRARQRGACTKHVVLTGAFGGPDRTVWVYGPHRTPGNACDGDFHIRKTAWW